jgi:hypothetical protein
MNHALIMISWKLDCGNGLRQKNFYLGYGNMKQFFFSKLKKFIFRNSGYDQLLIKIHEIEKEIKQIKLEISDTHVVKIEKIVVKKIVCEKIENNYKIDSITTDNLSGTMNVGTIYPSSEPECTFDKEKPLDQSNPEKPKLNIVYK